MNRQTLQVGGFEVNCTILNDGDQAWLIDPGQEGERLVAFLEKAALRPQGVLLTHAHFDHIGAIPFLQGKFGNLPVYVHANEEKVLHNPLNQLPPEYPPLGPVRDLRILKADEPPFSGLEIIETPGHTPGGVCYYLPTERLLLSGDTLFAGSVGRTDLPGGDMATLMDSLAKLTVLPDETVVIPGHGVFTTIGDEKKGNPFLL